MKEKNMANLEQYRAVLGDLLKQKDQLQFKIGEIDTAVAALRRLMPPEEIAARKDSQTFLPIVVNGKYTGMSNRWGILALLSEDATGPMTTGEIAEALLAGGMTSGGKSFAGNISAVLSKMNHDRGEVTASPQGWFISEAGREAWIHIKASRERAVTADSSLPTVQ
ncbi:hypothetical protein [Granulicella aggregans]|uniref:hypothetical protein n=1 Tax=Granulicella aggregans TaxID=474949 RepID=UPI0021E01105|nr:hypothetical protein [Granulicella aggregans]